ncbi:MAG: acyl carrier protein [Verrucomicrobia bacterium A1]|nr:MAG: acyl carrier protein [Verrucomicrobia bacterium A1]
MTQEEVIAKVNQVFEESFEIEKGNLQPEKHIFTDLGLDSLDIVDLIVALQKAFAVQIRDSAKVREVRTLGDLYRVVLEIKEEQEAAGNTPRP